MAGTLKRTGPVALSATLTTNIFQGGGGSALIWDSVRHVSIVNKTAGAVSFSLWLGATGANAAGTEVFGTGRVIAANSAFEWYGAMRMDSTDFLVGGASAGTSLTILIEREQFVV